MGVAVRLLLHFLQGQREPRCFSTEVWTAPSDWAGGALRGGVHTPQRECGSGEGGKGGSRAWRTDVSGTDERQILV